VNEMELAERYARDYHYAKTKGLSNKDSHTHAKHMESTRSKYKPTKKKVVRKTNTHPFGFSSTKFSFPRFK
jgi:hypothetical protein